MENAKKKFTGYHIGKYPMNYADPYLCGALHDYGQKFISVDSLHKIEFDHDHPYIVRHVDEGPVKVCNSCYQISLTPQYS